MHIPDGFIDAKTAVAGGILAVAGIGIAIKQVRQNIPPRRIPLLGLSAAFIFAAQMLNFPVLGGTSGHLIGGTLAAVLLGPGAAALVMTSVLILQCLMFADGGITALGANVLNMAIIAPLTGYAIYSLLYRIMGKTQRARFTAIAFASWCSTVIASMICAGELALSGTASWGVVFPAMAGIHVLIGLGEAVITTIVLAAIFKLRPELELDTDKPGQKSVYGQIIGYGVIVSLGLVIFVAPFASPWPDGLERVAESLGFDHAAASGPIMPSPLPDYTLPGIGSPYLSTILAGIIGTMVAFALSYILARGLTPGRITENGKV